MATATILEVIPETNVVVFTLDIDESTQRLYYPADATPNDIRDFVKKFAADYDPKSTDIQANYQQLVGEVIETDSIFTRIASRILPKSSEV